MNQLLTLYVLPPTTNHSHIHTRAGFTFPSKATNNFREEVAKQAKLQNIICFSGWLGYRIDISFGKFKNGKWKKGDASNRTKQLEDALNGIAWIDDEQVIEAHIYRHFDEEAYCKISINTLNDDSITGVSGRAPEEVTQPRRNRANSKIAGKQTGVGVKISVHTALKLDGNKTVSSPLVILSNNRVIADKVAATNCPPGIQGDRKPWYQD